MHSRPAAAPRVVAIEESFGNTVVISAANRGIMKILKMNEATRNAADYERLGD
jgi:hypothetical protein